MDDILISGKDEQEHMQKLSQVFKSYSNMVSVLEETNARSVNHLCNIWDI